MSRTSPGRGSSIWVAGATVAPAALILIAWEVAASLDTRFRFLFASPSLVLRQLAIDVVSGELITDFLVTGGESALGLILGSVFGSCLGLSFWFSPLGARVARPYVAAAAAVPAFALAPMTIIWFGTGLFAKVMMAALATFFVAVVQAFEGAKRTDAELVSLVRAFGGSRWMAFRKVVAPASFGWIVVSCRLNVGFSILGAFVGEFISADRGLAHHILRASGLYDVPRVLTGVLGLMVLSALLAALVRRVEAIVTPWYSQGGEPE